MAESKGTMIGIRVSEEEKELLLMNLNFLILKLCINLYIIVLFCIIKQSLFLDYQEIRISKNLEESWIYFP